ncbi:MAG: YhbY family RNA-binding protein [Chloroflexi bacterium]|nr:YhbY family RNA-binding protein [Chloroflexota bacterium]
MNSRQRARLRSLAHALRPALMIGQHGLTEAVIRAGDAALAAELIKVRFLDHREERAALAARLATALGAELVGLIGHVAIVYRRHHDPARRVIVLAD